MAAESLEANSTVKDAGPSGEVPGAVLPVHSDDVRPQKQQEDDLMQPSASGSCVSSSSHDVMHRPYISPCVIQPFPKAALRKVRRGGHKKGSSKILTDSPERQKLIALSENRKRSLLTKTKQCLFNAGRKKSCPPRSKTPCSSDTDDSDFEFDDVSSDSDGDIDLDSPIIEGDFVVVKCAGKSRTVNYIARVDTLNGEDFEFEGVFLQKVAGKVGTDKPVFVPNPKDEAGFNAEDVVYKLPQPNSVGSSVRCSSQLVFSCDLSQWQLH